MGLDVTGLGGCMNFCLTYSLPLPVTSPATDNLDADASKRDTFQKYGSQRMPKILTSVTIWR